MEKLYEPELFRASENMDLKSYFKKFNQLYTPVNENLLNNEELSAACSIDKLTVEDEPSWIPVDNVNVVQANFKLDFPYKVTDTARKLNVVQCRENLERKTTQDDVVNYNKRFFRSRTLVNEVTTIGDIIPGSDVIYTVIIYRPFLLRYEHRNSSDNLRFSMEMEALGTNSLTDIVDNIKCLSNDSLMKKMERTTDDMSPLLNAKAHYPGQTIFIDGVFYNDTRVSGSTDYSEKIIPWAESKNIGKFTTGSMEQTLLNSLKMRLGYPYVYIHQGNCEHIISFSDARLITKSDTLQIRRYPRITCISRRGFIHCFICSKSPSKWMVHNCDRLPHERVFLCTECCNSYLYINGEKVTNFDLYPYLDRDLD